VHNDIYAKVIVEMLMVQKELYKNEEGAMINNG